MFYINSEIFGRSQSGLILTTNNMKIDTAILVFCMIVVVKTSSAIPENRINEDSFSFLKFSGPVSGEAREVVVPNSNIDQPGIRKADFVAKPDYTFTYGVHDKASENSHTHTESRDGDSVHGEYRVLQPDGLVRIVRYTADPDTGFKVSVQYTPI